MKKRVLSLLLCGCLAASMIAGCGSSSSEEVVTNTDAEDAAEDAAENAEDTAETEETADTSEAASDMEYVLEKGTLVVGITNFEPMDYMDENGEWIGFDADLANAFAESLGITAEFVEIDWDSKILELDSNAIDCVWNGMTLTDEVTSSMECTDPYLMNAQVVVVPADVAEDYQDVEDVYKRQGRLYAFYPGDTRRIYECGGLSGGPLLSGAFAAGNRSAGAGRGG